LVSGEFVSNFYLWIKTISFLLIKIKKRIKREKERRNEKLLKKETNILYTRVNLSFYLILNFELINDVN
jgi:hypothetical protein